MIATVDECLRTRHPRRHRLGLRARVPHG
jgi:hypothetical protein